MLPNTFGCNSFARRMRALIRGVSSDQIEFSTVNLGCAGAEIALFMVKAISMHRGHEIGRIVSETSPITKTCYVHDVVIHDKRYARIGLAEELIKRAFGFKEAKAIAPVNIVREAMGFWVSLANKDSFPIRLGLIPLEIDCQKRFLKS